MRSADWTAIEDALYDWLHGVTGLPVIWSAQDVDQPATDYLSMQLDGPFPVGRDYQRSLPAETPTDGAELELVTVGEREVHLTINAFSAAVTGASTAARYVSKAQLALSQQGYRRGLKAAGISVFDFGRPQQLPQLLEADFQGRVAWRLRFSVRDGLSEFVTYIEKVTGTHSIDGGPEVPFTFDAST
jgi:hypothetical protein